jgi:hypothetical protein
MIFIKGNFPSFKNSKQFTGKFFIMSKTVQKYLKAYEYQWKEIPQEFLDLTEEDYPVIVGFHFVRNSKHRWDFHNMVQGCSDLMVKHGWIPDDSMDYFIPAVMFENDNHYSYDKENPGVYVKILQTHCLAEGFTVKKTFIENA